MTLPLYASQHIGQITTDDGQSLNIFFGLDENAVKQFTAYSCDLSDIELHRFTSDYKRICEGGYETWYAKERYPYGLIASDGTLAGIIWFGPKTIPSLGDGTKTGTGETWHTFAIRLYPPYRGRRLALPFAQFVFAAHSKSFPGVPIWLDTATENAGAIRLYQKLGFVECGQTEVGDGDGRLVMKKLE